MCSFVCMVRSCMCLTHALPSLARCNLASAGLAVTRMRTKVFVYILVLCIICTWLRLANKTHGSCGLKGNKPMRPTFEGFKSHQIHRSVLVLLIKVLQTGWALHTEVAVHFSTSACVCACVQSSMHLSCQIP